MIVLNESTKGFLGKGRGWTVRILVKNTEIVERHSVGYGRRGTRTGREWRTGMSIELSD
jgi:hypothetical protein